jgi:(2Fe-2S) ferredoxin
MKHVLVCCNKREEGHPTPSCKDTNGEEVYSELKNFVMQNNLIHKVIVTRTRCLGYCNKIGTTVVIHPENIWLKEVTDVKKVKDILLKSPSYDSL